MHTIKGTAFVARKKGVVEQRGEAAWDSFMKVLLKAAPFFYQPVLVSTMIPLDDFLTFQDTLVRYFYDGQDAVYATLGAAAAQWGLTEGPYRIYAKQQDAAAFVKALPSIWRSFFNFGECSASLSGNICEVTCWGLPVWHPYLEYLPMAYFKRGFELTTAKKVTHTRAPGPARTLRYTYHFCLE